MFAPLLDSACDPLRAGGSARRSRAAFAALLGLFGSSASLAAGAAVSAPERVPDQVSGRVFVAPTFWAFPTGAGAVGPAGAGGDTNGGASGGTNGGTNGSSAGRVNGDLGPGRPAPPPRAESTSEPRRDSTRDPARDPIQNSEIRWLRSVLETPSGDPATRLGAAERLLRLAVPGSPASGEATLVLVEALRSADEARVGAVVDAVRSSEELVRERLPKEMAVALVDSVQPLTADRREPFRAAMARLGEDAAAVIEEVAADAKSDEERRLAAVWALEAMTQPRATEALVALLDPARSASEPIRNAVCDALERSFPRGIGRDGEKWRAWWRDERGANGAARGGDSVVDGLRARLLEIERRLAERDREVDRLADRIGRLYGEVLLGLDPAQRQERTVRLLADELPQIRAYALTLVDRMLLNFEVASEPLQDALLENLSPTVEPIAALRQRALKLLDDIKRPDLAERVAPAFLEETDPATLKAYLALFQQRPATDDLVFARLVELLEASPGAIPLGEDAARALVRMGDLGALGPVRIDQLRPIARRVVMASPTPPYVRLAGAVAEESVLDQVEGMLRSSDRAMRRAVADVMRQRGRRAALYPVAEDEAIYPVAIRAAADPPASIDGLRRILGWKPPSAEAAADRDEVVKRLALAMPLGELLEADDLLAAQPWAGLDVRTEALERVLELPAESLSATVAQPLLIRLGGLLVGGDDPRQVQAVLDRLGTLRDPASDDLRFAAAVVQQQYDAAEQLRSDSAAWIELLEQLWKRRSKAAAPLRDEMRRRFQDRLAADERTRFEAVSREIAEGARSASTL